MNPLVIAGLKNLGRGLFRFTKNAVLDGVEVHVLHAIEELFYETTAIDKPMMMAWARGRVAAKFDVLRSGMGFWKRKALRLAEIEVNITLDEVARRLPDISRKELKDKLVEEIRERFTRARKGRPNRLLEGMGGTE